ncbi:MAG: galactose mutarotase [Firmicutes bacterium]|nr:galactose mutarotase [Bacillota bacterium]
MERKPWGTLQGQEIERFTLDLGGGARAEITNFGGALVRLFVPDREGNLDNVVLGYENLEEYVACTQSMGILVGRHANRIEDAKFTLGDTTYQLAANDGRNHLHGGPGGFGKVIWEPEIVETEFGSALKLSYLSPDGEEGYPGNLQVEVTYSPAPGQGGLCIHYVATSDQTTVVNLTNHAYFDLTGGSGSILDHKLQLDADFFTPINSEGIPTGEIHKVAGTPLDFRKMTPMGQGIDADHEQIRAGKGYDHNWIINGLEDGLKRAARVEEPTTGRMMEVWTTKPGIQFYSGNFLKGEPHAYRSGFCLETQFFPNSLRFAHFPRAILPAGERYEHTTIYDFLQAR